MAAVQALYSSLKLLVGWIRSSVEDIATYIAATLLSQGGVEARKEA
jgi:hypothetical protein